LIYLVAFHLFFASDEGKLAICLQEEMRNSRIQRRVYELLSKAASAHGGNNYNDQKELHFVFFRRPTRFNPAENGSTIGAVQLEKTVLKGLA